MGNTRSATSTTTPEESNKLPSSTPEESNKLQQAYENLIANNEQVAKDLDKYFCTLRILVVGKTGSGKSTLIRLLLGDDGPRSMSHGSSGQQDIDEEWRHPRLPLFIHDSDGISTNGKDTKEKIEQFLENRLKNSYLSPDEIPKRVHAVWYVFSALQNRVLDDNGLLKMLCGKQLPLLLIMTHNDRATKIGDCKEKLVLQELLESISDDDEKRERLRQSAVRVGNEINVDPESGQITKVNVDEEALLEVSNRTMQLLAKEMKMTWAACQAVDMMSKVKASISFILHEKLIGTFALPAVSRSDEEMKIILGSAMRGLSKIWNDSENLEKAIIFCKYLEGEQGKAVMGNLSRTMKVSIAVLLPIIVAAGISVAPFSTSISALTGSVGAATFVQRHTSKLFKTYCLHVLCGIMYVRTHDVTGQRSVDDYVILLQEFFSSQWVLEISEFAQEEKKLTSQVTEFFQRLSQEETKRISINGMSSGMGNSEAESSSPSNWIPEKIQLQGAFERLISNNAQVAEDLKNTEDLKNKVGEFRVLVVGRSGSGKSTLIRLLLGDDGPRIAGQQNIEEEWKHPDLPLIFHDSNGVDPLGNDSMAEIEWFLCDHQPNSELPKCVHAVWYVFNALDDSALNDDGLLKMLDGYGEELPLLLIMTHNDIARYLEEGMVLEQVLESISNDEKRERLRQSTIRVGNYIRMDSESETGQITKVNVDEEALRNLLDKTLRMDWVACRTVDMMAKLKTSESLIIRSSSYDFQATGSVMAEQMKSMFNSVTTELAKIWEASENLQKAVKSSKYLEGKQWEAVMSGTFSLFITYCLQVVCAFMYVRMHDVTGQGSVDYYVQLLQEFFHSNEISRFSLKDNELISQVTEFFQRLAT